MVYKDIWKNTDERGYVKWKKKNGLFVKCGGYSYKKFLALAI